MSKNIVLNIKDEHIKDFPIEEVNNFKLVRFNGYTIIVPSDFTPGKYFFIPLLNQISYTVLKRCNLFINPEYNEDKTKKGIFNSHGLVRRVKIKGVPTDGYLLKWDKNINFLHCPRFDENCFYKEAITIEDSINYFVDFYEGGCECEVVVKKPKWFKGLLGESTKIKIKSSIDIPPVNYKVTEKIKEVLDNNMSINYTILENEVYVYTIRRDGVLCSTSETRNLCHKLGFKYALYYKPDASLEIKGALFITESGIYKFYIGHYINKKQKEIIKKLKYE